jgi:glutamine synthetase
LLGVVSYCIVFDILQLGIRNTIFKDYYHKLTVFTVFFQVCNNINLKIVFRVYTIIYQSTYRSIKFYPTKLTNFKMSTNTLIAEYIWTDADGITFRSKTRVFTGEAADKLDIEPTEYPQWTYDGSSTGDVNTHGSIGCQTECRLVPYFVYTAPECETVDRYVLCMSKEIRDSRFCELCNTTECVCLDAPDEEPACCHKECNLGETESDNCIAEDCNEPEHPDISFETRTSYARCDNDAAIEFWQKNTTDDEHKPMVGFEQEFFVIDPNTGYPVGFVPSACPFTRALSHLGLRPRYTPVSGPQGPYYCSNGFPRAQLRDMMDEVLATAREMEIGIAGFNYEVAPGQAEFQVFGDAWEACNDLVMLRFLLVRIAETYGYKIDFRPVVVRGQNINNSGCHVNFSTQQMRAEGGIDYIYSFMDYLSDVADAYPHQYVFENLYGRGVCERLTGRLETSYWMDFSWGIGTRDTSVRIPIGVYEAKCGYFEDRRPGANVNPYVITHYIMNQVLDFESSKNSTTEQDNSQETASNTATNNIECDFQPETNIVEETDTETNADENDMPYRSIGSMVLSALGF